MADINDLSVTDGSNTARFPEGMLAGSVNNGARALEGILARWHKDNNGSLALGGTSTAITVTLNQSSVAAWYDGLSLFARVTTTCGATPTINPTGSGALGAKSLYWPDGTQLAAGDIVAGGVYGFYYELTSDKVYVIGAKPSAVGPSSATDNAVARFDGTTGKLIQNSAVTVDDSGNITATQSGGTETLRLDRTDTHGDNALVASYYGRGRDSGGATQDYGAMHIRAVLDNAGAETGGIEWQTGDAGSMTTRLHLRLGLYTPNATGTDKGADTINASAIYDDGVQLKPVVLATEQASTSGTSIDFTSIPAGVKRITIMFVGVSTNGTSNPLVQIGDTDGVENTGYSATSGTTDYTAGFGVSSASSSNVLSGAVTLTLEDAAGFTWVATGLLRFAGNMVTLAGSKSLSAELDRVRITTVNGTDTFDAGAINIMYE